MRVKYALIFLTSCGMAAGLLILTRPASRQPEPIGKVHDILPRVNAPAEVLRLKDRLQHMLVFVDPVTGELRRPEAGEHAALTGATRARAIAAAPAVVNLPGGGAALPLNPSNLEFLVAARGTDGSISYRHAAPSEAAGKGGRHAQ